MWLDWQFYLFVRYDFQKNENNLLICESLELHATGKVIFDCVDTYNKTWYLLDKFISVCTDDVKAMTGKLSGAVTRIKKVASAITAFFTDTH